MRSHKDECVNDLPCAFALYTSSTAHSLQFQAVSPGPMTDHSRWIKAMQEGDHAGRRLAEMEAGGDAAANLV